MHTRSMSVIMAAVLCTSLFFTGCQKKDAQEDTEPVETKLAVTVTTPVRGDIDVRTDFSGSLEYADEISVFPKLSGEVTQANFEEGDYVNAGDLLFTLDDESYQMSLRNAQAAYDTTEAGMDQKLGALKMNRDSAEDTIKKAEEGIGQAQNTYSYYQKQYSTLEDNRDDLEEDKSDMKEDKKSAKKKYKKAKSALKDAKDSAAEAEAKYQEAKANGAGDDELTALKAACDQASAAVSAAQTNVNTLKTTLSSLESGIDQLDKGIDQLDSSEDTLDYQMANLNYTYQQALRGTALAKESLEYYDLVTLPDTIKTADASLRQAQVGIDTAKLQLEYTQIKAPVSGVIKTKNIDRFDMVQAGMAAYVITNDDTVIAAFNVPESVYRAMSIGQSVIVDRNGEEFKGTVTELAQSVDDSTGLFKIKASLEGAVSNLSPGTTVKITAVTNHVENVVTIPVDCVYYSGGEAYTYVVEDGVVRKVFVTPGLYDSESIEIVDGVSEGMQVVTVWSSDLRDGLEVDVKSDATAAWQKEIEDNDKFKIMEARGTEDKGDALASDASDVEETEKSAEIVLASDASDAKKTAKLTDITDPEKPSKLGRAIKAEKSYGGAGSADDLAYLPSAGAGVLEMSLLYGVDISGETGVMTADNTDVTEIDDIEAAGDESTDVQADTGVEKADDTTIDTEDNDTEGDPVHMARIADIEETEAAAEGAEDRR